LISASGDDLDAGAPEMVERCREIVDGEDQLGTEIPAVVEIDAELRAA